MSEQRIVITGFMCSGKSSLARALAELLDCPAVDLDEEITTLKGHTPAEIIARDGEAAFRKVETNVLRKVLERGARIVALGGGAWTIPHNRDLIAEFDCFSVWLDVPFEICWKRITTAGSDRPMARDWQQAKSLYERRHPLYDMAKLRLEAKSGLGPKELAARVRAALANLTKQLSQPGS